MAELMDRLLTAARGAPVDAAAHRAPIVGDRHAPGADTWQGEFAAMAARIKARHASDAAAKSAGRPAAEAAPRTLNELRTELAGELVGFDPTYDTTDDHGFWCAQSAKALRIANLRREIALREAQA